MNHSKPLLGFHASTAGGLHNAIIQATSLGCTTLQLFTKNNRTWKEPIFSQEDINLFLHTRKKNNIKTVISHASYLINLASARADIRHISIASLTQELNRCAQLEIEYVVLHPGSHTTLTKEEGIQYIIDGCNQALENSSSTILLLETMAGQGSTIGSTFEEIATIIKGIQHKNRIGICLDTCHIFAAGYAMTTEQDYHSVTNTFDTICGFSYLKAIHLNDSKKDCGSRVDRHEHITEGKIGEIFFTLLMNDPKLACIPKILETPQDTDTDNFKNLSILHNMIKKV